LRYLQGSVASDDQAKPTLQENDPAQARRLPFKPNQRARGGERLPVGVNLVDGAAMSERLAAARDRRAPRRVWPGPSKARLRCPGLRCLSSVGYSVLAGNGAAVEQQNWPRDHIDDSTRLSRVRRATLAMRRSPHRPPATTAPPRNRPGPFAALSVTRSWLQGRESPMPGTQPAGVRASRVWRLDQAKRHSRRAEIRAGWVCAVEISCWIGLAWWGQHGAVEARPKEPLNAGLPLHLRNQRNKLPST